MKKLLTLSLALLFLLCAGCSEQTTQTEETNPTPSAETTLPTATDPVETFDPTEASTPETTVPVETTAPGEETEPEDGYIERIPLADQSIFSEPSFESTFVGVVGKATNYTIVEEATDSEGNLWGKLKSGRGWVNLTEIRSGVREKLPVTANLADEAVLKDKNTIRFTQSQYDYVYVVAFRPNQTVTNFRLYNMELGEDQLEFGECLFTAEKLTPETPLVADLYLPGDLSTCAIVFEDAEGVTRCFYVADSLWNGTIYISESNRSDI